jgi:hypothetical protein
LVRRLDSEEAECATGDEVVLKVEGVVHRGMDRKETLG